RLRKNARSCNSFRLANHEVTIRRSGKRWVRTGAFVPKTARLSQAFPECTQNGQLPPQDLPLGFFLPEPASAIHLRKSLHPAGARRPFHAERVAADSGSVQVAFHGKCRDELAARLADGAKGDGLTFRADARLLFELATGGGKRLLALRVLAFRNGPGPIVLLRPIGPAGVDEENLGLAAFQPIEQEASATFRHESGLSSMVP